MNNIISFFRAIRGAADSFEGKIAPHLDGLFRQAYQYTGSVADAEDLLQDLLLELYSRESRESQLAQIENVPAWLNRCLYHRFIDRYRKEKRQPDFKNIDDETLSIQMVARERPDVDYYHQQVISGLKLLSPEQRAVISLHDISGHTLPELAQIMEMPIGTLKSHLHRGRQKLKSCLELQLPEREETAYQL